MPLWWPCLNSPAAKEWSVGRSRAPSRQFSETDRTRLCLSTGVCLSWIFFNTCRARERTARPLARVPGAKPGKGAPMDRTDVELPAVTVLPGERVALPLQVCLSLTSRGPCSGPSASVSVPKSALWSILLVVLSPGPQCVVPRTACGSLLSGAHGPPALRAAPHPPGPGGTQEHHTGRRRPSKLLSPSPSSDCCTLYTNDRLSHQPPCDHGATLSHKTTPLHCMAPWGCRQSFLCRPPGL